MSPAWIGEIWPSFRSEQNIFFLVETAGEEKKKKKRTRLKSFSFFLPLTRTNTFALAHFTKRSFTSHHWTLFGEGKRTSGPVDTQIKMEEKHLCDPKVTNENESDI